MRDFEIGSNHAAPAPARRRSRRWLLALLLIGALLLVLLFGMRAALQPARVSALLLRQAGNALGLQITASGMSEYRLRGTPQLVLRDVTAREPGAETPVLRAERILVALPWSTIRSRGQSLVIRRIELDAPVLNLPAYLAWQARRPTAEETRIPTLSDGLGIVRGRIQHHTWAIEDVSLALPSLAPDKPLQARSSGRFNDGANRVAFDLAIALSAPSRRAQLRAHGPLDIERKDWRMRGALHLAGPMTFVDGAFVIAPASTGYVARYLADDVDLPLRLGAHGPFAYRNGVASYGFAALQLRGEGLIPQADARGALAMGERLALHLQGALAKWPQAWPALPPPLGASDSPLPFALDYLGRSDLSAPLQLHMRRKQTVFDARLRLPQMLAWIDQNAQGSPIPPLQGQLRTPELEIAGARLHDVQLQIDDPGVDLAPATPAKP